MADITTIAELGTAAGTLILAVATFGSVRSANRAARVAERSLELGLRRHIVGGWLRQRQETHPEIDGFRQQMRDLYIPPSDTGFWQAGIRDDDPYRSAVETALEGDEVGFSVFLLYGDHEGGQRAISRFGLRPHEEEGRWFCSVSRHWTLEGPDPRGDVH
jgi:hypothetical protein